MAKLLHNLSLKKYQHFRIKKRLTKQLVINRQVDIQPQFSILYKKIGYYDTKAIKCHLQINDILCTRDVQVQHYFTYEVEDDDDDGILLKTNKKCCSSSRKLDYSSICCVIYVCPTDLNLTLDFPEGHYCKNLETLIISKKKNLDFLIVSIFYDAGYF